MLFVSKKIALPKLSILLSSLLLSTNLTAPKAQATESNYVRRALLEASAETIRNRKALQGWDYLYNKAVAAGADHEVLYDMLSDKRMPKKRPLSFSLTPRESSRLYRHHNSPNARKNALRFFRKHQASFLLAEDLYGVPKEVILSILQVETKCGAYTGNSSVLIGLARLASAASPRDVESNYEKRYKQSKFSKEDVQARADWLEQTFLPHLVAGIQLAEKQGVHPLELRGSHAGALGLPQFLPGNIQAHGADGNNDGRIDLFDPEDAIVSVARFLGNHGWTEDTSTPKEKKEVILHYNRSDAYVKTVLSMAQMLNSRTL